MIRVLQNSQYWLELTQTWLYTQVNHLQDDLSNVIACYDTQNLDKFGMERIHSFSDTLQAKLMRPAVQRGRLTSLRFDLYNRWLYNVAVDNQIDILHSHFGPLAWRCNDAAVRADLKHIVTFYGYDVNGTPTQDPRWRDYYKQLFQTVSRVLCEGPFMASQLVALGCPQEKVHVHHLGIQLETVDFKPLSWQPNQPLKILMAASFREKKGFPYGIEAIGKFAQEYPVEVTIIGDAGSDPTSQQEKANILAKIDDYDLTDTITMRGYRPYSELLEAMHQHHIFLSPSVLASNGDSEGGAPVSIIEASASGMMVVSTTHCDIPNVIKQGQTGLLAPDRDSDALVAHLRWFTQHPERWQTMAESGRAHIEANFDAIKQGIKLGEVYRSVVS